MFNHILLKVKYATYLSSFRFPLKKYANLFIEQKEHVVLGK